MPFQIFNGQTGHKRLIVVDPQKEERATVILRDGSKVVVAPSMTVINGYPGIRVTLQGLPSNIVSAFESEVRTSVRRVQTLRQSLPTPPSPSLNDDFDRMIARLKAQQLLCANISIGLPLRLVLPKTMFTGRNRFELSPVKELVVDQRVLSQR